MMKLLYKNKIGKQFAFPLPALSPTFHHKGHKKISDGNIRIENIFVVRQDSEEINHIFTRVLDQFLD